MNSSIGFVLVSFYWFDWGANEHIPEWKNKEIRLANQTDLKVQIVTVRKAEKGISATTTTKTQKKQTRINFKRVFSIDFLLKSNADFVYVECWTNRKSYRRDYKIKYHFFSSSFYIRIFRLCAWISGGYRKNVTLS